MTTGGRSKVMSVSCNPSQKDRNSCSICASTQTLKRGYDPWLHTIDPCHHPVGPGHSRSGPAKEPRMGGVRYRPEADIRFVKESLQ